MVGDSGGYGSSGPRLMAVGVRVQGLRELIRALRNLPPEYLNELKEIHRKSAEPVHGVATRLVPVVSGDLKGTIRVLASRRAGRVAAGNNTSVVYAGPIHWGWPERNIKPQPFLTDALDQKKGAVLIVWQEETDSLIGRVWRRAGVPSI